MAPRASKSDSAPASKKKSSSTSSSGGSKRPPSAYNIFMKEELPKVKAKHPELNHKEAFKKVAESWKNHPSNPKKA